MRVIFENRAQIQRFLESARRDRLVGSTLVQLAKEVAPPLRPSRRGASLPTESDLLEGLWNQIECQNAVVTVSTHEATQPTPLANSDESTPWHSDLRTSLVSGIETTKKTATKLLNTEIYILETTFTFDENSDSVTCPVVVDRSSVESHSSGWKSIDDPFEIKIFGALKGLAAFRLTQLLGLGNSAGAAAGLGAQLESTTVEYQVNGRSVIKKNWYGSYAIRYNLRRLTMELAWLRFDKCGPSERWMVELKRQDRVVSSGRVLYTLIRPSWFRPTWTWTSSWQITMPR